MKLFSKIDQFFKKHDPKVFFTLLFIFIVLSILLFNRNISTGGDDSGYMIAARDFLKGQSFPTWHGSFYPIFLSVFIPFFGLNVIAFKIISLLLMAGHLLFFYSTFKKRTPAYAFWLSAAITAFSAQFIFYSSQTYSESLFLFLQAFTFYLFYRYFDTDKPVTNKQMIRQTLLLSFVIFLLSITRNIGIFAFIPFVVWLLIEKKYKQGGFLAGFYFVFHIILHFYKSLVWHLKSSGVSGQIENMAWKNFYNHRLGKEDFWGYVERFWGNSNLYLSKHIPRMLGLKSMTSQTVNQWVTILIYILFIGSAILIWKKKRKLIPVGIYLALLIAGTFISQQTHWDQERLILIYLPLILLFIGTGIYLWISEYHAKWQLPAVVLAALLIITTLGNTLSQINHTKLHNTFSGDAYSSFTPDWENYLKMCHWAGQHLPKDAVILCRKPDMADIYGHGTYKGQYRLWSTNPDTLKARYLKKGITHVIMANLRVDPRRKTNRTINTIRKNLAYLTLKYPAAVRVLRYIGRDEPAYLFELDLKRPTTKENILTSLDANIIINPENFTMTRLKADEYFNEKQYPKAAYFYSLAIKANPHPAAEDFFKRGICSQNLQRYSIALKDYRKAQSMNLKDPQLMENISFCESQAK